MAEHIDKDANNLCITEDVFEKFQAESMYEEEELITLSDILPSNVTVAPSASDDVIDLLADENVTLSGDIQTVNSGLDNSFESVQHFEVTTGPGVDDGNHDQLLLETSELNVSENIEVHTECEEEKQPKRRGRQKKRSIQELDNVLKEQPEQFPPKRRGRRKKDNNCSNIDMSIEEQMKLMHEDNSDITNNDMIQETLVDDIISVPELPKRRGRKKKLVQEPIIDTNNEETNTDTGNGSEQLDISSQNGQEIEKPRRRGRKKKVIPNGDIDASQDRSALNSVDETLEFTEDKIDTTDDLPISQIKQGKMNNDTLLETTNLRKTRAKKGLNKKFLETYDTKTNVTSVKRRGRPKKQDQQQSKPYLSQPIKIFSSIGESTDICKVEEPSSTVEKLDLITNQSTIDEDIESTIENGGEDDPDDISLSNLKRLAVQEDISVPGVKEEMITSTITLELEENESKSDESPNKKNSKSLVLPSLEYNLDNIANEGLDKLNEDMTEETKKSDVEESLLVEDTSRRPIRRKIKRNFQYQEDSDEDPFANVELSDDEPRRGKKGSKYYSDDEYIPGKKRGAVDSTESSQSSDMDAEDLKTEGTKQRKKRFSKKTESPKKRSKKSDVDSSLDVTTIPPASINNIDDIEVCLESSLIKNPQIEDSSDKKSIWGNTNEFENFIAQKIQGTSLKIKKVSSSASTTSIAPLDIPTLDTNANKTVEISTQTTKATMKAQGVQTSPPYDIPMKDNVALTKEQSQRACEFLNSIVKTTSELGVLMTEKSEDFMKKKIHTDHVTDTFKMDYCVRKSFLLFKLAKHNLMQMEEDLAQQYEEFLKTNNLENHRDKVTTMSSKPAQRTEDNDSDCEIVEVKPTSVAKETKTNEKAKFNPKTVFLNKELSIKIAKKPADDKKLQIKERHTVWINDSVILKKVTPTQSFLAQDSRNKKPPDNQIEKNVHDFFRDYERQKVMSVCAPFVSADWMTNRREYACNYFVAIPESETSSENFLSNSSSETVSDVNKRICNANCESTSNLLSPKSLFSLCTLIIQKQFKLLHKYSNIEKCKKQKQPPTLLQLCLHTLNKEEKKYLSKTDKYRSALTLKEACYKKVMELFNVTTNPNNFKSILLENNNLPPISIGGITNIPKILKINEHNADITDRRKTKNGINKLFSLCVKHFQDKQKMNAQDDFSEENILDCKEVTWDDNEITVYKSTSATSTPPPLKNIAFKKILHLIYDSSDLYCSTEEYTLDPTMPLGEVKTLCQISLDMVNTNIYGKNFTKPVDMTINSINTMSEEAFLNIENTCSVEGGQYQYFDDDDNNCYEDEFEPEYDFEDDTNETLVQNSNWVKQLQMKELKSCLASTSSNTIGAKIANEPVEPHANTPAIDIMVNIKDEPIDDELVENSIEPVNVKTEPTQIYNETTIVMEHLTAKTEPDTANALRIPMQRSDSYDGDAFEQFVTTNKMMLAIQNADSDEIFSQSALRIRRQFDPDSDDENDAGMSLLVPHTYQPLKITEAKDTLMKSSSDESNKDISKKKVDKRKKKNKKIETKINNKDVNTTLKSKTVVTNEVAVLTRRMRDRIRQEAKKVHSSDSESETQEIKSKSDKKKGKIEEEPKILNTSQKSQKKYENTDIQCNSVDSTEQIENAFAKTGENRESIPDEIFSGFSIVDQNEMTTYQKHLKDVYDKILPKIDTVDTEASKDGESAENALQKLNDEPVEYLECEPTLPIFEKETRRRSTKKNITATVTKPESQDLDKKHQSVQFVNRHGWQCYPIDVNDKKLYDNCQILLDKLPETFVQMYFQYQNITERSKEDDEVDRLINLQSLNRTSVKELKGRGKARDKAEHPAVSNAGNELDESRADSAGSDRYQELTPSEDDDSGQEDEPLSAIAKPTSENTMAKSSLMDDDNSDSDAGKAEGKVKKIKEEAVDSASQEKATSRPGPKSKTKPVEQKPAENLDLMLTADKMMNKELSLLHAPINLEDELTVVSGKKASTKGKQKTSSKKEIHYRIKNEDDSSSEEEKQWVTTKEKLLKRLEKKHDTTIADEAKRTKIVSEYIERCAENPEPRLPQRRRGRRSNKKFLERQKQLRVLTRELLGDAADSAPHSKRYNQAYFKGRRNIRKVIDKKSLTRSTVMANMAEFERKRRLTMKQAKLCEILGCEESVNVLVINDELCLEYDFEQQVPVVAVHPFFTKIMKAHQYEGVKFMWDACFESLSQLAAGSPGGGCILAHCMGLGKTLQVLALLHTVLTHPGAGMQRVLVCCPLSTVLNWVDEIHKWIGPVTNKIKVFELSKLKKTYERAYQLEDWYSGGGIFIIGYELFRSLTTLDPYLDDVRPTIVKKIRTALLDPGPDIIVCDEGHLLKNDCSVLAVAMSRVVTKRRIVLTGTPMQNNLREYYCMVNFVKPNLLGTYAEFSNRFENPIMNGQHRDSSVEDIKLMKARTHILHKVLEGCLQRQEASVLYPYLPKKYEYTVFISPTKCQWDMYKYYLTHYAHRAKNGILKDFHILQKVWSHPQVLHHFQTKARDANANKVKAEKLEDDLAEEDAATDDIKPNDTDIWWLQFLEGGAMLDTLESSNKFVVVFRILDECIKLGDKVLIFSTSLFTMDTLEFFLRKINKWSLGHDYYRLDGSVPAEVRQKWCREFNAEHNVKTKLFLISTRAGSLGLNMTAANRVIILDTSWNPAHDIQSIFRVYRFGQKKDCFIYRLVALGTMEQKIYERSVTKQAVACRVVDEQQIDRHYNMQELTELYRFDESGSGVASGVAPGVRDVALLRVARLRALHAVHEHDSLLRGSEPALPEHERQAAWSQFQQEHENEELENNKKVKKISAAVKRTYSKTAPATVTKAEPDANDSQDFKPPKEPKAKRGRKSATQTEPEESILPDPDTERINTLDPITEQAMVKKITELLVRHNYSYKDAEAALPQLVMNIRRIMMTGQDIGNCDDLTASIARVLMMKQDDMSMPLVNGIIGESINQTMCQGERAPIKITVDIKAPPKPTIGRPKKPSHQCKKGYVYEEVPSTSAQAATVPLFDRLLLPNNGDVRTKRKAALVAEKLLDTVVGDGVIDLDDDDNYDSSTDSASETNIFVKKQSNTNKNTPENAQAKPGPRSSKLKQPNKDMEVLEDVIDTSILLSDDEEGLLNKTAVVLEPQAAVSLHPSLLRNGNFIKIVAHTYLAGNPMLDEDAAMLAARYSTFKAVKELETTGKPIVSGPIYDIAVQVLGKPILQKLHDTTHKIDTGDDDAQSNLLRDLLNMENTDQPNTSHKATESKPKEKVTKEQVPEKAPVPKKPVKKPVKYGRARKVYLESSSDDDSDTQIVSDVVENTPAESGKGTYLTQVMSQSGVVWPRGAEAQSSEGAGVRVTSAGRAASRGVVPVGLFKTTVSVALPGEEHPGRVSDECILPDDDDIRIVSDVPSSAPSPAPSPPVTFVPAAEPAPQITPPSIVPLSKLMAQSTPPTAIKIQRNGKPIILKMVRPGVATQPGQLRVVQSLPVAPSAAPSPAPPALADNTICLDSDDEDTPLAPVNTSQPILVPASNTYLQTTTKVTDVAQKVKIVPKVLTKVDPSQFIVTAKKGGAPGPTVHTSEGSEPNYRYIVIPKSQMAQMYPPLVPLPPGQVPPNIVHSTASGTIPMNTQAVSSASTVFNKEKQVSHTVKPTPTTAPVVSKVQQKGVKTSAPSLSIDCGKILNYSIDKDENITVATKPTPLKLSGVEHQSTPAKSMTLTKSVTSVKSVTSAKPVTPAKPITPAKPVTPAKPARPAKPAERQRSVSSDSDSDSSVTDCNDDPLSILKDVIHIQADTYDTCVTPPEPKEKQDKKAPSKSLLKPQKDALPQQKNLNKLLYPAVPSKKANTRKVFDSVDLTHFDEVPPASRGSKSLLLKNSKPTTSKAAKSTTAKTPSSTAKTPSTVAKTPSATAKTSFTTIQASSTTAKQQSTATKSRQKIVKAHYTSTSPQVLKTTAMKPVKVASQHESSNAKSSTSTKTSQLTKPVQIPISKSAPSTASKTVQSTSTTKTSSTQPAPKKRAAPVEAAPVKKKKTDHLMTLKDFNIDDIDDIIELD